MICGDVSTRAAESANIRPFCSMWRSSRVRWSSVLQRQKEEAVKLKKAEYMLEHVGEEYDGVISGVTWLGLLW
mgnify:CR=1 FL=1